MLSLFHFFDSYNWSIIPTNAIAISTTFFILISAYVLRKSKFNDPYCPVAPSSYIQSAIQMSGKDAPGFVKDMFKKTCSNTFFLRLPLPGWGIYIVGDVPTVRSILQDPKSDKPPVFYQKFEQIGRNPTIFTRSTSNHLWKSVRKSVAKAFSSKEVRRMNKVCSKCIQTWINEDLETFIHEGSSFDPSTEMVNLTFNVVMESAVEYPCTSSTKMERTMFLENSQKCLEEFVLKETSNPFRKYLRLFLTERKDAFKARTGLVDFGQKVLDNYRANTNKSEDNTIIKLILNNEDLKSDKERVAEILTFMIAGFETTGYTLSSTLILLAKHPSVAKKLRKELMRMDQADWSKSPYLRCVIQESKRLLPVAVLTVVRSTGQEFVVQTDPNKPKFTIPKGANVMQSNLISFHDPATFEDPETFIPERWEKGRVTKEMDDAMMLTYAVGSRNCVGQRLAVAELYSSIPHLVAGYDFEVEEEGKIEFFLTMKYIGCRLKATRAKDS